MTDHMRYLLGLEMPIMYLQSTIPKSQRKISKLSKRRLAMKKLQTKLEVLLIESVFVHGNIKPQK